MSTTELGKELRRIRIDSDERLFDMAAKIEISSAFVSAVENGKKSPPAGFEDRVIQAYRLVGDAAERIRSAANRSRTSFTFNGETQLQRDTFGLMARRMKELSSDDWAKMLSILQAQEEKK